MRESISAIESFVPKASFPKLSEYLNQWQVNIVITRKRYTKHGDFRALPKGGHQITVNEMSNPYRFLITTLHEIAHLIAYKILALRSNPTGRSGNTFSEKLYHLFLCRKFFQKSC